MIKPSLSAGQLAAIGETIRLGRRIQEDFPEVADLFRSGLCYREVVQYKKLDEFYERSVSLVVGGAKRAIVGNPDGDFGTEPYQGLIPKNERAALATEHRRINVETQRRLKLGIYGQTPEERRAILMDAGLVGGPKGGQRAYELGVGIHGLSSEERKEAAAQSLAVRGLVAWQPAERKDAYQMAKEGMDRTEIVYNINSKHHDGRPVRTKKAVSVAIGMEKNSIAKAKSALAG